MSVPTYPTPSEHEPYGELRPLLLSIAYRLVGSVSEAEDLVQEAFLRYHDATQEEAEITYARAYLSTVTTRLAIDHLRSARVRRETYVGPWLPEPLVEQLVPDPSAGVEATDSLSLAFMLVLERLSPVERAVFVLHDAFDYSFEDIAEIVGKSEANCRQLAVRARRHIAAERPRFMVSRDQHERITDRFVAACQTGDMEELLGMLSDDAVAYTDGGGRAIAVASPIHGGDRVARLVAGIARSDRGPDVATLQPVAVNGRPGRALVDAGGTARGVFTLDVADGRVRAVHLIVNPDKLRHLPRFGPA